MKVKQSPEDFQVEELTDVAPTSGAHALYRLEKSGWSTPDAIAVIQRRWKIQAARISFGGLKDRHAATKQYLTIQDGPRRHLRHARLHVAYLGQTPLPYVSTDIRSNRFQITLRDLSDAAAASCGAPLNELRCDGLPNYFDDQRFGSVAETGDFAAKHLIHGDYAAGLRLVLTSPYEHDRATARSEKAMLRAHWGDWTNCRAKLAPGKTKRLIDHLARRPTDFAGAFSRLGGGLGQLHLAAFQSHLWNRMLSRWLQRNFADSRRIELSLKLGTAPALRGLTAEEGARLDALRLPLLSARLHYDDVVESAPADWRDVAQEILAEEGLELAQMRLPGLRRPFFSRGERPIWFRPIDLKLELGLDERHAGRRKLVLSFDLLRGSYATLLIKRLAVPADPTA